MILETSSLAPALKKKKKENMNTVLFPNIKRINLFLQKEVCNSQQLDQTKEREINSNQL